MDTLGTPDYTLNQLQNIGSNIGLSQGGAPLSPAGYTQTDPATLSIPANQGSTTTNTAAQQAAAQNSANSAAISAGYDSVLSALDRIIGGLPGQQQTQNTMVNNQADSQRATADGLYGRSTANLDKATGDLNNQTSKGLRNLATQLRSSFDGYSNQIGANGGGDSSANGQLSFALQKVGAQNRSDIQQNADSQLGNIALKRGDLDFQHNDTINQLNTWKNNQILSIAQQFQAQKDALDLQRAGASRDKMTALASMNSNLINSAMTSLAQVEAQHQALISNVTQQIQSSTPQVNSAGLTTDYAVQNAPQYQTPGMATGTGNTGDGTQTYAAFPTAKKLIGA
jgi:hypothetical protein